MKTFAEFIENAKQNLCKEYTEKLNRAGSKKALLDLALDANGIQWTSESIAKGDLPIEVIANDFKPFLNGIYTRNKNGYTTQIYCRPPEDEIKITATATLIIGFKGKVVIDRICRLYLCNSDVTVVGNEHDVPEVYLYNSSVVNSDGLVRIEERKDY